MAQELRQLLVEIKRIQGSEEERRRRLDYIAYELEEFEKIKPQAGESDLLELERSRLLNIAKLADLAGAIKSAVDGTEDQQGIASLAKNTKKALSDLLRIDKTPEEAVQLVDQMLASATETSILIGSYLSELTFDPERLEEIETRLNDLGKITRRFGSSLDDVFTGIEKLKAEMDSLAKSVSSLSFRVEYSSYWMFRSRKRSASTCCSASISTISSTFCRIQMNLIGNMPVLVISMLTFVSELEYRLCTPISTVLLSFFTARNSLPDSRA